MVERSNSFEQIELLPASPPSLEASISSRGATPARKGEKERDGEDLVKSKPAAQVTYRRPASLVRKSNGRADAEGGKNAPSRYFVLRSGVAVGGTRRVCLFSEERNKPFILVDVYQWYTST